MVNDMLALYEKIMKGVKSMIRTAFLFFLVILMGSIIIVLAFTEGWVKIVVTPSRPQNGIEQPKPENGLEQRDANPIEDQFMENQLFSIIKHVIEPGETLFDLENLYGTNWRVIQRLNKIKDPIHLQPGTIIRVPIRIADS